MTTEEQSRLTTRDLEFQLRNLSLDVIAFQYKMAGHQDEESIIQDIRQKPQMTVQIYLQS